MSISSLNSIIKEGEWEKLKNNPEYQDLPNEKKVLFARRAVNNKLREIDMVYWETVKGDIRSARIIVEKRIKPLRNLINALNAFYAGVLDKDEEKHINKMLGISPPKTNKAS